MLNKLKKGYRKCFISNVDNKMGNEKEVSMDFIEGPGNSDRAV